MSNSKTISRLNNSLENNSPIAFFANSSKSNGFLKKIVENLKTPIWWPIQILEYRFLKQILNGWNAGTWSYLVQYRSKPWTFPINKYPFDMPNSLHYHASMLDIMSEAIKLMNRWSLNRSFNSHITGHIQW